LVNQYNYARMRYVGRRKHGSVAMNVHDHLQLLQYRLPMRSLSYYGIAPVRCNECARSPTTLQYRLPMRSLSYYGIAPVRCNECARSPTTLQYRLFTRSLGYYGIALVRCNECARSPTTTAIQTAHEVPGLLRNSTGPLQ